MYHSTWDLEERSRGIDPRWLRGVPLSWQDEIAEVSADLRLAWSHRAGMWGLLRRNPAMRQEFEDGQLLGWTIVTWFESHVRPDEMKARIAGMFDAEKYGDVYKAAAAAEKLIAESRAAEKRRERARIEAAVAEVDRNIEAVTRDENRRVRQARDRRSRAHDGSKSGIFVGGA